MPISHAPPRRPRPTGWGTRGKRAAIGLAVVAAGLAPAAASAQAASLSFSGPAYTAPDYVTDGGTDLGGKALYQSDTIATISGPPQIVSWYVRRPWSSQSERIARQRVRHGRNWAELVGLGDGLAPGPWEITGTSNDGSSATKTINIVDSGKKIVHESRQGILDGNPVEMRFGVFVPVGHSNANCDVILNDGKDPGSLVMFSGPADHEWLKIRTWYPKYNDDAHTWRVWNYQHQPGLTTQRVRGMFEGFLPEWVVVDVQGDQLGGATAPIRLCDRAKPSSPSNPWKVTAKSTPVAPIAKAPKPSPATTVSSAGTPDVGGPTPPALRVIDRVKIGYVAPRSARPGQKVLYRGVAINRGTEPMALTTSWTSRGRTVRKTTLLNRGERVLHPLPMMVGGGARTIGARFTVTAPDGTRVTKAARTKVSRSR